MTDAIADPNEPDNTLKPYLDYAAAVVTSDVTVLPRFRALYIGVSGDVAIRMWKGQNVVTFKAVPVGILAVAGDKVMATNTTATNILALA
jgi:hypothetical protein